MAARLLGSIVESSEDAIISKSLDGVIQTWNAAAERLFGHPADRAIGKHISLVIPPERIGEEDQIVASLKAGQRIEHFETERVRMEGGVKANTASPSLSISIGAPTSPHAVSSMSCHSSRISTSA